MRSPAALAAVAAVGRVAVGGLDGVAVQHRVVAGLELSTRADPAVHLPQLLDPLRPGVALPRTQLEPALRARPDPGRILVEGGEEAFDVLDRSELGRPGHLGVQRGRDPVPLSPLEAPPHGPLLLRRRHGLSRMKR